MKKKKTTKKPKVVPSEEELVRKYADGVINLKKNIDHGDRKRFYYDKKKAPSNKDLWMDTDFFFSVVFQSAEQKYEFLTEFCKRYKVEMDASEDDTIQIVNGVKLAKSLGIAIRDESAVEYPYPDLELRPLALDLEIFDRNQKE